MSLFITFEGGEGCGKSTQARALYRFLARSPRGALFVHEPGGTSLGKSISYWLKWRKDTVITPLAELLLFNASRANLVEEVMRPALREGKVIVCDRFTDSTLAYQGHGHGLNLTTVKSICDAATAGLTPDLTILLDIPVEEGMARKDRMRRRRDRIERADASFHQRVRNAYLEMARAEPARWFVIDGQRSRAEIADMVRQKVERQLTSGSQYPGS